MGTVSLTEKAAAEVKHVMGEQKFSTDEYALEVGVVGGGCSGFTYKLGFKKKAEINPANETMLAHHGVDIVVGKRSMLYLDGATVDFHDGLNKRGFVFENPNSKGCCGCGQSFTA
jgi:iron-sulfur cluster assembly protein